nr:hypothetical protein [uncultured Acetatifactor sp.]
MTGTAVLGGVLYAAFGLKPVMDISVVWFFITASFECFIRLRRQPMGHGGNVLRVIRHDFIISIKFNVAAFCGMQIAVSIFSVFAVSLIQQNTPGDLIGKVMAYTSAVTLCAQPAGQTVYGFLFDGFREAVFLVLTPTGAAVCLIGLLFCGVFRKMESACQACGNQTEKVSSDSGKE